MRMPRSVFMYFRRSHSIWRRDIFSWQWFGKYSSHHGLCLLVSFHHSGHYPDSGWFLYASPKSSLICKHTSYSTHFLVNKKSPSLALGDFLLRHLDRQALITKLSFAALVIPCRRITTARCRRRHLYFNFYLFAAHYR